jgi:hypothetical protein
MWGCLPAYFGFEPALPGAAATGGYRNDITHIWGDNRHIYELTIRVSFLSLLFKRISDLFPRLSTPDVAMGLFSNTKSCHFLINTTGNNPWVK